MNHWWRAYNTAASDPKLGGLTDWQHRCWFQIMCMASDNGGAVPAIKHVAYTLRVKPEKAAEVVSQLHAAGLLDKTDCGFIPHNWNGRQYKSDTSTERVKRFRNAKRNVSCNDSGNAPEQIHSRAEPEQSKAEPRTDLQGRVGDFRQAIVQAFAEAKSPNLPETSRAELWLAQGFEPEICLAVIAGQVSRRPSITTLNYFDAAIAEAHTKKAPPRKAISGHAPLDWDAIFVSYKKFGRWSRDAGNDPLSPNCRAPPEMLRKYGFEPVASQ
jgi:hypothetical protein